MLRKKLQGQVAIVTGASRGIGAATARLLADAGCAVVLTARDEDSLQALANEIRRRGAQAVSVPADISDPDMAEEIVESAVAQFDRVDIVVNCAGTVWPLEEAVDTDLNEWAYGIHVNLVGPFLVASNALAIMLDQDYGRVVNLTCRYVGEPKIGTSAYFAAKAGLEEWARVVAKEMDGTGVTVVCLDPGIVDTELRREILDVDRVDSRVDISAWLPDAEPASLRSPEEAARMVYWLVGPWSHGLSGQVFRGADAEWQEQVNHDVGVGAQLDREMRT